MASPLNIPFKTVLFFFIAVISGGVVVADDCRDLCGYIAPTTHVIVNASCGATGDMFTDTGRVINWNDGTFSTYTVDILLQLAIGSCCSEYQASYYATGIVTSGRFSGADLRIIYNDRSIPINTQSADEEIGAGNHRQTCNACQSSAGLSRVISPTLLSIGTKGVGNWIECTGATTEVFSPPLTSTPKNVYSTLNSVFDQCSNCVESC